MMPNHFISALEPIFVFGLVALFALVSFRRLSTVITCNVQLQEALLLAPEETISVTLAKDESAPMKSR